MTVILVGVDGGGTKTRALVADERGERIAEREGAASAVRPGQAEQSADTIAAVVREALDAGQMSHVVPKVLCVGVAGVGRDPERQALWQALVGREVAEEIVVHTDGTVALDDAFGDGPGVLLVSGTGSMCLGRGPTGTLHRCGGWGPVFGDEGSGAWIGRRALSIVAAASDGREPETALSGAVLTAVQADAVEQLIEWAAQATPADFAALLPSIAKVAEAGDLRANALVSLAVEELALHVRTIARQAFGDERAAVPVAFTGGLLRRGTMMRKRLEHRLKSAVPGAQVRDEDVDAARGAVKGALRFLGVGSR